MYSILLLLHSLFRWLVLVSLLYAIIRAYRGYAGQLAFSAADNSIRHWMATIAHSQLTLGFALYFISPVIDSFRQQGIKAGGPVAFFGFIHIGLMLLAIVLITLGSSIAKRQLVDRAKFRVMLIWFSVSLLIILLAIPWPFSPLASRPYFRLF